MSFKRNALGQIMKGWGGTPAEKLAAKSKRDGECIVWTGHKRYGYGQISDGTKKLLAHRVAFELANGPIAKGMVICHRCDRPECVNPEHLFIGTQADNIRDMVSKGRHLTGEKNPASDLTPEQVKQIRFEAANGRTQISLSLEFGVSRHHISNIVRRVRWAHL